MKKTKIIATYGPAIASASKVSELVTAGVNLFRVNCSHGTTLDFVKAADTIKSAVRKAQFPVGLLLDISGPKLRLERFEGKLPVKAGQRLKLTAGRTDLDKKVLAVNHPAIISSVRKGQKVYIDDGNLVFDVVGSGRGWVTLRAVNAGTIMSGKGINLPRTDIKIPTISDKDKEDIKTAIRVKADYIALSFVRSPADVVEARRIIESFGGDQKIIAKLEKRESVANLEKIIKESDGVMIARGDLGVEVPFAELPRLQKDIIRLANYQHKPVIVATQMLESMRFSPRATRAEVNDVATAVFDLTDAVMLSAETATGKYPVEAVKTMEQIITATESRMDRTDVPYEHHEVRSDITHSIAHAVSSYEHEKLVKVIFAFTTSGFTASLISNLMPPQPIIALTPNERVRSRLTLLRSVYPVTIDQPRSFDDMLATVEKVSERYRLTRSGEKAIITGGVPFGSTVPTNFMMIHEIGKKRRNVRRSKRK
ncbi:MAG: pyruvate kinase [Candidatus Zixiibacteriota bacterium]|nr:MAG: pyruvate kinase [candidate division Zixibacteria bacterium]